MRGGILATILLLVGGVDIRLAAFPQSSPPKHAVVPEEQRADINHASIEELVKVPGMTRTWAGRIVRFRPYRSKQDLLDRGIVNPDVYNRIRDYVIAHRENSGQ